MSGFFYGFSVTTVILAVLGAAVVLVYQHGKKKKENNSSLNVAADDEENLPEWLKKAETAASKEKKPVKLSFAVKSMCGVFAVALVIAFFTYAWVFGIRSYEGAVEDKVSRKGVRLQIYVYQIEVGGKSYQVGEDLYKAIKKGAYVKRPFAVPWTYVDGERIVYTGLSLFGAWCAVLSVVAAMINILIWLSYRDGVRNMS